MQFSGELAGSKLRLRGEDVITLIFGYRLFDSKSAYSFISGDAVFDVVGESDSIVTPWRLRSWIALEMSFQAKG